jgi:hypothetical protein
MTSGDDWNFFQLKQSKTPQDYRPEPSKRHSQESSKVVLPDGAKTRMEFLPGESWTFSQRQILKLLG